MLRLSSYEWNLHALPWALIGAALLVIAVAVVRRQRASRVGLLFALMVLLAGLWMTSFAAMLFAAAAGPALFWARLALGAVCLLPAVIYDFTATALRLSTSRRAAISVSWVLAAGFALVAAFTDGIVAGVSLRTFGYYPFSGAVAAPLVVFFFVVTVAQMIEGVRELGQTADPVRRLRLARLMGSFAMVYLAAHDFLPMFGFDTVPIGYVPVLGFMIVAWRSISRHRFAPITAARASREILETMPDALFVLDDEWRIRDVNGAAARLLGYAHPDLLGRSIDFVEGSAAADDTITHSIRSLVSRGVIRDQERVLRSKSGARIDVSVSISPVSEYDVRQGAVLIARDIRERKRAQEELHQTMRRLEQSNRELEDFAHVASHDLQEPLRKIQAFGDLLKSRHAAALDEQGRDYVDRMQSAARRMQTLINDLLSFSRVTTRAQPFVPVDLGQIAQDVAKDLEVRAMESQGRLDIGEMPSIHADPLQMRQLLQNLASNGLKFRRPDVPPVVRIRGSVNGAQAEISVEDNGIGFDPAYSERIFTIFERLHERTKYEGTGIGLAICRKIAERHGGSIRAESTPGAGSRFVVTLPVTPE